MPADLPVTHAAPFLFSVDLEDLRLLLPAEEGYDPRVELCMERCSV